MNHAVRSVVLLVFLSTALIAGASSPSSARPPERKQVLPAQAPASRLNLDRPRTAATGVRAAAVQDTTWLGYWTFDNGLFGCTTEGWVSADNTRDDTFTHIDDFAGLGGGDFGRLVPIEGAQSLWCGAEPVPGDYELCQYVTLPGYGDNWFQTFATTACLSVSGNVFMDFLITWDSEPGYDETQFQFSLCDDEWTTIPVSGTWGGGLDFHGEREFFSIELNDSLHAGSVRMQVRFLSDGAWSDFNGLWNTDGAYILDSLTVRDATGVVLPTELFEVETVGDTETASGNWQAGIGPYYGDFAGLYSGINVLQEDPCGGNITCIWGFFNGSTYDYSCGGYPGQAVVPYVNSDTYYIDNEIRSPFVPVVGDGTTFELGFDVYRDLPLDPLVFYLWHARFLVDGCPDRWQDRNFVNWGEGKDWFTHIESIGDLVPPGATDVQMALGCIDMCGVWCGLFGTGGCHTQAPLFDNAWIRRINSHGPVWSVRDIALFQDNFATDGTTTGTVRMDMAFDLLSSAFPYVHPGDSAVVDLNDPENGLAGDPHTGFGPAAYLYVAVWPPGQPGKSGGALTSDSFRWPVVDSLMYGGNTWYGVRLDSVFIQTPRMYPQEDRYCVDLNDNLFTPGDTICYVFCAQGDGPGAETTYYSRFAGTTSDMSHALSNPMEVTCLPASNPASGRRILYVDECDGTGVQPFFDTAFQMLGIAGEVDRYDIPGSELRIENGPASRIANALVQLVSSYHTIIWNSGNDDRNTLRDGNDATNNKIDDAALLLTFLDNLDVPGGIYFSGNNLAADWLTTTTAGAITLRGSYMNFDVVNPDHTSYGLGTSPIVVGATGGCFDHVTGPDTLVAFGGCPERHYFDVLQPTGPATTEGVFIGGGTGGSAVVAQQSLNPQNTTVGVMLSGFSFHDIRDAGADGVSARAEHLGDILTWLGNIAPTPTPADGPAYATSLAQNYPNPFNPTTTIEFTVRDRAPVSVRVYNVAGQLVKTLADGPRAPGIVHRVVWDGRNDAGQQVASGVYFYRLVTTDYVKTRKMVLLK